MSTSDLFPKTRLAMPSADEWDRVTKAVGALRADLGRVRKDYRELEQRVSLVEREQESAEDTEVSHG